MIICGIFSKMMVHRILILLSFLSSDDSSPAPKKSSPNNPELTSLSTGNVPEVNMQRNTKMLNLAPNLKMFEIFSYFQVKIKNEVK